MGGDALVKLFEKAKAAGGRYYLSAEEMKEMWNRVQAKRKGKKN